MNALRNLTLAAVVALGTTTAAVGQQVPNQPEIPTNVSPTSSLCNEGYARVDYDGDGIITLADVGRYDDFFYHADTNRNGLVNLSEFNSACSENLFRRLQLQSG
jgi:hypothetical protein